MNNSMFILKMNIVNIKLRSYFNTSKIVYYVARS